MLFLLFLMIVIVIIYVRWQDEVLQAVNGILPVRELAAQVLPPSDDSAPEEGLGDPGDLDNMAAVETPNQLTLAYANSDLLFPSPLDKFFFSPFWENRPSLAAE